MKKITDFLFKRNVRVIRLIYFVLNHPQHWMKLIRKMVNQHLFSAYKISLGGGDTALKIGCNLRLPHPQNIVLGSGGTIGDNVTIYHDVALGRNREKYPTNENDVIIYAGAKVIGDVTMVGIIGCNAVVTKNVPANAIVGGVPAKVLKWRQQAGEEEFE